MEMTVDRKYGIITGVDVYPANEKESLLVLRHLERQIQNGIPMQNIALDRGYDTGAVHRGLELLGITGYIPAIQFSNSPERHVFSSFLLSTKPGRAQSAPRRCISLSGRCQACLPAVELQSNDRKILALLSSAGGYLQTLQAKRYLLSANGHSAQNS